MANLIHKDWHDFDDLIKVKWSVQDYLTYLQLIIAWFLFALPLKDSEIRTHNLKVG